MHDGSPLFRLIDVLSELAQVAVGKLVIALEQTFEVALTRNNLSENSEKYVVNPIEVLNIVEKEKGAPDSPSRREFCLNPIDGVVIAMDCSYCACDWEYKADGPYLAREGLLFDTGIIYPGCGVEVAVFFAS